MGEEDGSVETLLLGFRSGHGGGDEEGAGGRKEERGDATREESKGRRCGVTVQREGVRNFLRVVYACRGNEERGRSRGGGSRGEQRRGEIGITGEEDDGCVRVLGSY